MNLCRHCVAAILSAALSGGGGWEKRVEGSFYHMLLKKNEFWTRIESYWLLRYYYEIAPYCLIVSPCVLPTTNNYLISADFVICVFFLSQHFFFISQPIRLSKQTGHHPWCHHVHLCHLRHGHTLLLGNHCLCTNYHGHQYCPR